MKDVYFILGRNVAAISMDATRQGLIDPEDNVFVVTRDDDHLSPPFGQGITITQAVKQLLSRDTQVLVIVNGGTTAQQIPLVLTCRVAAMERPYQTISLVEVEASRLLNYNLSGEPGRRIRWEDNCPFHY